MSFHIVPLSRPYLDRVRTTLVDDAGRKLTPFEAEGGEPLRCLLRRASPGERILLLSHSPFTVDNVFKEVGPVYIHADDVAPYGDVATFPPAFRDARLVLRAYGHDQTILDAELCLGDAPFEDTIARLLDRPEVAYLHARFAAFGCYLMRIDRG